MTDARPLPPTQINRRQFGLLGLAGAALTAGLGGIASRAVAQDGTLILGMATETLGVDPHLNSNQAGNTLSQHIFDRLVFNDENQVPQPALAESWGPVDDLTWEFRLRPGVTFHNGVPFTAEDVVFSLARSQDVPGGTGTFRAYLADKTAVAVDDLTLRITTRAPNPIADRELATLPIVSRLTEGNASTEAYNTGAAAIGTGPYRFVVWRQGQEVVLERNEDYWGEKPEWPRVVLRTISAGGSRVAAMLAGDVALIENLPPDDVESFRANSRVKVSTAVINRMIYLGFDQIRENAAFVTAKDGSPIPNPLRDVRVRKAISMAIDRGLMVERVLQNMAVPAYQMVPPGIFGHADGIGPVAVDVEAAKALLAEAGVPDGFKMTIHGPNGAYLNDSQVLQAIAQMLARIGITVDVEALPTNVFTSRLGSADPVGGPELSCFMYAYSGGTGEASIALRICLHSIATAQGFGSGNRGGYVNAEVDSLIETAIQTLDDAERERLLGEATAIAMDEVALAPIYFPLGAWAMRNDLDYTGRSDARTLAFAIRKV